MKPARRRSIACVLAALFSLLLAACGSAPPAPTANSNANPATGTAAADPWQAGLSELELRQRALADGATAQGRWNDVIDALEVLRALHPDDAALLQRLARARVFAETAARERVLQGRQASLRGDSEAAARAYLEALVLWPAQSDAADALRAIERERVRRQHLGKLSRNAMGNAASALQLAPLPQLAQNELEHASMLADQGEFAAAVATLKPLADVRNAHPDVTGLLADILFRQAESLRAGNKPAAIAALERCLQLDRTHARAAALLKELKAR